LQPANLDVQLMSFALRVILLVFAAVGFAGAGAALAITRQRFFAQRDHDPGMIAVAVLLLIFGALCALVGGGYLSILAFGGVILWTSYVAAAQRVGLFHVLCGRLEEPAIEEHRRP
jgi:hypothetical protein